MTTKYQKKNKNLFDKHALRVHFVCFLIFIAVNQGLQYCVPSMEQSESIIHICISFLFLDSIPM